MKRNFLFFIFAFLILIGSNVDVSANNVIDCNADLNGVYIYFSDSANLDSIGEISLKNNEQNINFTVDFEEKYVSGYNSRYNKIPAIILCPNTELQFDTDYTVSIPEANFEKTFYIEKILEDDFSSTTDKWQFVHTSNSANWQGSNQMSIDNGALKITTGSANSQEHLFYPAAYSEMMSLSDYTIEFDMEVVNKGDAQNNFKFYLSSSNNTNKAAMHIQSNGIRGYVFDGGLYEFTKNSSVASGMNHYKYRAINGRYQLYLNNEKFLDYTNDTLLSTGALAISFLGNNGEYKLDNVKMTKMIDVITGVCDKPKYDIENTQVSVQTSHDFKAEEISNEWFIIWDEDGNEVDFNTEATGNNAISFTFDQKLKYKTVYTISITDKFSPATPISFSCKDISFVTIDPPFDLKSFVYENGEAKAVIVNNRVEEPVSFIATIVFYDENNKMIDIAGGKGKLLITEEMIIQKSVNAAYAKCFVWDNYASMNTLFEK